MQLIYFTNGGYVIHKLCAEKRTSAWFDEFGKLIDVAYRTRDGKERQVKQGSTRWNACSRCEDWQNMEKWNAPICINKKE